MVPTLALAIELRERMVAAGARGLEVHAAYRPEGGAPDSQHKHNAALDLDLLPGDDRLMRTYVEVAAQPRRARCCSAAEAEPGDGWHEIAGVQLAMDAARAADRECVRPWRT